MFCRLRLIAVAGMLPASALLADFSYVQTTSVTGGQMASMMGMAGRLSGRGNQPATTTHYLKSDRMATVSGLHASIVDVAAETITEVDFQKKTYSVMTFAQMKQFMEQMGGKAGAPQADLKVSANRTGATKKVSGVEAQEIVISMEMEMTDQKSGKSASTKITTDTWVSSEVAGYDQVRAFYKKMGEKVSWAPGGGGGAMMGRPDLAKGMEQVAKEMAKLDGMRVLQVVKMGAPGGQSMPQMTPEQQAQMASAQQQADTARAQAAQQQKEQPQIPSASSAIAGALGVPKFGGFGKKKPAEKAPAAEAPTAQAAPAPATNGDPSVFLETTIEASAFSTASVEASKVEVPAGFTKVDSPRMGR